jgi:hypothetical protein
MFNKIFKTKTNMKKLEKLAAIAGIASAELAVNQLAEINQELAASDLNVEVSAIGTVGSLESQVASLTTQLQKATDDLQTANQSLQAVTLERDKALASLEDAADSSTENDKDRKIGDKTPSADEELSSRIKNKYNLD